MPKYQDGELTMQARKDIDYFEEDLEVVETYTHYRDSYTYFRDGVMERISKIGYNEDIHNSDKAVDFVCQQFRKHNIEIRKNSEDRTRNTIKRWLSTKNRPNDSAQSRTNVYKLCFALEMNKDETEEFFLKKYLCRPFNLKDQNEAVYFFCLNTNREFQEAQQLIHEVELLPDGSSEEIETKRLELLLSEIETKEDFLIYMVNHRYSKQQQHNTATKEIQELLSEGKERSGCSSNNALLKKILGYDYGLGFSKSDFPEAISSNFPSAIKLSQIFSKTATDDTYRKMLIVLYFYNFYAKLKDLAIKNKISEKDMDFSDAKEEFEVGLDQLLDRCGYIQTYYRNPYDQLILYCSICTKPLDKFQCIIQNYYT